MRRDILVLLAVVLGASLLGLWGSRPLGVRGVFTVDGIALGMTADEVLAIRGEPKRRERESWVYDDGDWGSRVNIVQLSSEPTIASQQRYVIGTVGKVLARDGVEVLRAVCAASQLDVLGSPLRTGSGKERDIIAWAPAGVAHPVPGPHAASLGHFVARVKEGRVVGFGLFLGEH